MQKKRIQTIAVEKLSDTIIRKLFMCEPTILDCFIFISFETGVNMTAMKRDTRKQKVVYARHLSRALATFFGHGYEKIKIYTNSNHATVIHSVETVADVPELQHKFLELLKKFVDLKDEVEFVKVPTNDIKLIMNILQNLNENIKDLSKQLNSNIFDKSKILPLLNYCKSEDLEILHNKLKTLL